MDQILQIIIIVLAPGVFIYFLSGKKIAKILSPVVLSYALGIALATFGPLTLDDELSMTFSKAAVLIAIPLLLFSSDILAWFKHAKKTVLSFFFAILAALISCVAMAYLLSDKIDGIWNHAAMLTGVYTGGTANLQAVGVAINASSDNVVAVNTIEMLVGGLYLLFLTSIGPSIFAKVLPKFEHAETNESEEIEPFSWSNWRHVILAMFLAILVAGASVGLIILLDKIGILQGGLDKNGSILILCLTSISVLLSFIPKIRELKGSFETGDYLIMMFCISVGMMSDLTEILGKSGILMVYVASTWILTVGIHLLLSIIGKIDRDTTIITSTAALYGPPFVAQIASVLGNRKIVFAGMATGLFGYAVGNYLGISVFYVLKNWLG